MISKRTILVIQADKHIKNPLNVTKIKWT